MELEPVQTVKVLTERRRASMQALGFNYRPHSSQYDKYVILLGIHHYASQTMFIQEVKSSHKL